MDRNALKRMTATSLLIALVFVLGQTPIGFIPLGVISLTIMCIPVIIGTMFLGLKAGLLLGAAFGTSSLIALTKAQAGALEYPIWQASMLLSLSLCYIPRLMIPLVTHHVYALVSKRGIGRGAAVAAIAGSLTNTVFYLGFLLLFYVLIGEYSREFLLMIAGIFVTGGLPEALVAALTVPPILKALSRINYFS